MVRAIKFYIFTLTIIPAALIFGPVRGQTSIEGGSFADRAFQAGRTSNGINFADGSELNLNPQLPLNLNPLDAAINSAGVNSIDTQDILRGFKFNLPLNVKNLNIDTNIPISPKFNTSKDASGINLRQFLTPKDISSDDLIGTIKAIVTLIIEIFLVVISITSQILKLILEFLR